MRDFALLLILGGFVWIAWWRPWLGVLGLTVLGYMSPHAYAVGFMKTFPVYLILFAALLAGFARGWWRGEMAPQRPPGDWRLWGLLAFWGWFVFTTYHSLAAFAAWPRLLEVSKSLLPLLFTLWLIDRREKLLYLLVAIALSFVLVGFKGAYWALMHGFSDRVYGPPGSHFFDNNLFAVAVIMCLPLLMLWLRETRRRAMRMAIMAMMGLCLLSALSSWSRGAMLTLLATLAMLIWDTRRKHVAVPLLLAGMALAALFLPEQWFSRMETTAAYQGERSAESRLEVWQTGFAYFLTRPLTGTGFDGWQHVTQGDLDWHNSYVEILVEQGAPGLVLWGGLLVGTLFSLTRLAKRGDQFPGAAWVGNYSRMLRASLIAYACGGLFLGISYWDLYFHLLVISVVLTELARREWARDPGNQARAKYEPG